jgi:hypothetical protein
MFSIGVERIVIACVCFWEGWKSNLVFLVIFCHFWVVVAVVVGGVGVFSVGWRGWVHLI